MRIFEKHIEYWECPHDCMGMLRHIERCARICYKSPLDDNPIKFIKKLVSRGHLTPLEHGTVYLILDPRFKKEHDLIVFFERNPYSKINSDDRYSYVTSNYRVLVENNIEYATEYMVAPTPLHERRHTIFTHMDIGLSREENRHRTFSICEQSTRCCNFSKDRFSGEIEIMKPYWWNIKGWWNRFLAKLAFRFTEKIYMKLIKRGLSPQEARIVLTIGTGTRCAYTAFESDWNHFFDLRCAPGAHPDMRDIANQIKNTIEMS